VTSVLIASSRAIVRDGIRHNLEHSYIVGEPASDASSLMFLAGALQPNICIVDFGDERENWSESVLSLRRLHAAAKIMAFVDAANAIEELAEHDAILSGYLGLCATSEDFETAIRNVLAGEKYICPCIRELLESRGNGRHTDRDGELTPRQTEILRLLAVGKSAKEVARDLGLSKRTIEFHKYRAMRRLGIDRSAQLVQYAIEHDLLN